MLASYGVDNPNDFFYALAPDEVGPDNMRKIWDMAGERVKPEDVLAPEGLSLERLWVGEQPGLLVRLPRAIGSNEAHFMLAVFVINDEKMVKSCIMFALEKCDPELAGRAGATMLGGWDANGRFSMGSGPDENDDFAATEKAFHEQVTVMLQQQASPLAWVSNPKQE